MERVMSVRNEPFSTGPASIRELPMGSLMRLVLIGELWLERGRQRRMLGQLNDHLLKDIGVSRSEAMHEAGKPFWRA
jgi:uncharacterized protein YjiS (DUF1127 family)